MQQCPSTCPSVVGGVCSVTVQGQLAFQVQEGSRSVVLSLQSSLGKPKELVLLLSLSVYPRAGKVCPMERTRCTGVGYTWEPLAVLLQVRAGPAPTGADGRAG